MFLVTNIQEICSLVLRMTGSFKNYVAFDVNLLIKLL